MGGEFKEPVTRTDIRMMVAIFGAGVAALGFLVWFAMTYPVGAAAMVGVAVVVAIPFVLHRRKQARLMREVLADAEGGRRTPGLPG